MKLRVLPTVLAFLTLAIAASLVIPRPAHETSAKKPSAAITKKHPREAARIARQETREDIREADVRPAEQALPDESTSLAAWEEEFQNLLAAGETRENAAIAIAKRVDQVFAAWVEQEITAASGLDDAQERMDRLILAETQVKEGAAAIYQQLELSGGRRIEVAADAMDALAAEIQYADAAPDHAARLTLLRLDRERNQRMDEAHAITDESAKSLALRELDQWYESSMGELFAGEPSDR